ncbi:DUF1223 domain-containing protein [Simiduia curdlanivorans]|uniref:DUF1223 domain-containing protein n=1 Tax=Simiduia curdlanivorans TaxID=1492769 RepID=A0ABV8V4K7_9GAMM|nr:DUF1223 domain-containing protein [Simiduia curdlanivorans]MDN3640049.1 DUF1223 domain-containing protein [Simiduia curdlanivorans]
MKTLLLALVLLCPFVQAQTFHASEDKAQLIELFTSQGCSSCPNAERWLNNFKSDSDLWVTLFPIAWHVDYWDDLGWVDKFSSTDANHRQYRYHHQKVTSGVYTPQAVINGVEWRALMTRFKPELPETKKSSQPKLSLHVSGNKFTAQTELENTLLNLAVIGMDFSINVKRGENSGRILEQQFVMLGFAQYPQQGVHWQGELPASKDNIPPQAVIAWITEPGNNTPLSITGGPLAQSTADSSHP